MARRDILPKRWPKQWLARLGARELWLMLLLLLAGGSMWLFIELADEVMEGATRETDTAILLALRNPADRNDPLGPGWLQEVGRDFTALGGVAVMVLLTAAVAGFLVLQGKRRAALFVILAVAGGVVLSTGLKSGFERPRPDLVPHGSITYTASFPSGHSMMAAVVYLTLGTLLARTQGRRRLKAYLLGVAVLLTLLVGVSRVYLGVHWPSDVAAGWAAGAAWAIACWLAALWLQHRGRVEPEEPAPPPGAPRPAYRPPGQ